MPQPLAPPELSPRILQPDTDHESAAPSSHANLLSPVDPTAHRCRLRRYGKPPALLPPAFVRKRVIDALKAFAWADAVIRSPLLPLAYPFSIPLLVPGSPAAPISILPLPLFSSHSFRDVSSSPSLAPSCLPNTPSLLVTAPFLTRTSARFAACWRVVAARGCQRETPVDSPRVGSRRVDDAWQSLLPLYESPPWSIALAAEPALKHSHPFLPPAEPRRMASSEAIVASLQKMEGLLVALTERVASLDNRLGAVESRVGLRPPASSYHDVATDDGDDAANVQDPTELRRQAVVDSTFAVAAGAAFGHSHVSTAPRDLYSTHRVSGSIGPSCGSSETEMHGSQPLAEAVQGNNEAVRFPTSSIDAFVSTNHRTSHAPSESDGYDEAVADAQATVETRDARSPPANDGGYDEAVEESAATWAADGYDEVVRGEMAMSADERSRDRAASGRAGWEPEHGDRCEGTDWNSAFQVAVGLPTASVAEQLHRLVAIQNVLLRFKSKAEALAKDIATSVALEGDGAIAEGRAAVGGRAGGEKFIRDGLFVKLARDSANMYGGDAFAMKTAGLDRLHQALVFSANHKMVRVAPTVQVDVAGLRMLVMPVLPINDATLVYGSADAARTVHTDDAQVNNAAGELGRALNLMEHAVGSGRNQKRLWFGADVEIHRPAGSSLAYLLDAARLLPPEQPRATITGFLMPADDEEELGSIREAVEQARARGGHHAAAALLGRHVSAMDVTRGTAMAELERILRGPVEQHQLQGATLIARVGCVAAAPAHAGAVAGPARPDFGTATLNTVASVLLGRTVLGRAVLVSGEKGQHLAHVMRPEAVLAHPLPLSADAFTGFGRVGAAAINERGAQATRVVLEQAVTDVASLVVLGDVQCVQPVQLVAAMKERGVNCRHLGLVRSAVGSLVRMLDGTLRDIDRQTRLGGAVRAHMFALTDMVARTAKANLREAMRIASGGRTSAEASMAAAAEAARETMNTILGGGAACESWWHLRLPLTLRLKFGVHGQPLTPVEMSAAHDMRLSIPYFGLAGALAKASGLLLQTDWIVELSDRLAEEQEEGRRGDARVRGAADVSIPRGSKCTIEDLPVVADLRSAAAPKDRVSVLRPSRMDELWRRALDIAAAGAIDGGAVAEASPSDPDATQATAQTPETSGLDPSPGLLRAARALVTAEADCVGDADLFLARFGLNYSLSSWSDGSGRGDMVGCNSLPTTSWGPPPSLVQELRAGSASTNATRTSLTHDLHRRDSNLLLQYSSWATRGQEPVGEEAVEGLGVMSTPILTDVQVLAKLRTLCAANAAQYSAPRAASAGLQPAALWGDEASEVVRLGFEKQAGNRGIHYDSACRRITVFRPNESAKLDIAIANFHTVRALDDVTKVSAHHSAAAAVVVPGDPHHVAGGDAMMGWEDDEDAAPAAAAPGSTCLASAGIGTQPSPQQPGRLSVTFRCSGQLSNLFVGFTTKPATIGARPYRCDTLVGVVLSNSGMTCHRNGCDINNAQSRAAPKLVPKSGIRITLEADSAQRTMRAVMIQPGTGATTSQTITGIAASGLFPAVKIQAGGLVSVELERVEGWHSLGLSVAADEGGSAGGAALGVGSEESAGAAGAGALGPLSSAGSDGSRAALGVRGSHEESDDSTLLMRGRMRRDLAAARTAADRSIADVAGIGEIPNASLRADAEDGAKQLAELTETIFGPTSEEHMTAVVDHAHAIVAVDPLSQERLHTARSMLDSIFACKAASKPAHSRERAVASASSIIRSLTLIGDAALREGRSAAAEHNYRRALAMNLVLGGGTHPAPHPHVMVLLDRLCIALGRQHRTWHALSLASAAHVVGLSVPLQASLSQQAGVDGIRAVFGGDTIASWDICNEFTPQVKGISRRGVGMFALNNDAEVLGAERSLREWVAALKLPLGMRMNVAIPPMGLWDQGGEARSQAMLAARASLTLPPIPHTNRPGEVFGWGFGGVDQRLTWHSGDDDVNWAELGRPDLAALGYGRTRQLFRLHGSARPALAVRKYDPRLFMHTTQQSSLLAGGKRPHLPGHNGSITAAAISSGADTMAMTEDSRTLPRDDELQFSETGSTGLQHAKSLGEASSTTSDAGAGAFVAPVGSAGAVGAMLSHRSSAETSADEAGSLGEAIVMVGITQEAVFAVTTTGRVLAGALDKTRSTDLSSLGVADTGSMPPDSPAMEIASLSGRRILHLACGSTHALFVTATGDVLATGTGEGGALGMGDRVSHGPPRVVTGLARIPIARVFAGEGTSFALGQDGALFAWGANGSGQLGLGRTGDVLAPTRVRLPAPAVKVAGLAKATVVLTTDGVLMRSGEVSFLGMSSDGDGKASTPTFRTISVLSRANDPSGLARSTSCRGDPLRPESRVAGDIAGPGIAPLPNSWPAAMVPELRLVNDTLGNETTGDWETVPGSADEFWKNGLRRDMVIRFVDVAGNNTGVVAVATDGRLFTCGNHEAVASGALRTRPYNLLCEALPAVDDEDVRFVASFAGASANTFFAVTAAGELFAWGNSDLGMEPMDVELAAATRSRPRTPPSMRRSALFLRPKRVLAFRGASTAMAAARGSAPTRALIVTGLPSLALPDGISWSPTVVAQLAQSRADLARARGVEPAAVAELPNPAATRPAAMLLVSDPLSGRWASSYGSSGDGIPLAAASAGSEVAAVAVARGTSAVDATGGGENGSPPILRLLAAQHVDIAWITPHDTVDDTVCILNAAGEILSSASLHAGSPSGTATLRMPGAIGPVTVAVLIGGRGQSSSDARARCGRLLVRAVLCPEADGHCAASITGIGARNTASSSSLAASDDPAQCEVELLLPATDAPAALHSVFAKAAVGFVHDESSAALCLPGGWVAKTPVAATQFRKATSGFSGLAETVLGVTCSTLGGLPVDITAAERQRGAKSGAERSGLLVADPIGMGVAATKRVWASLQRRARAGILTGTATAAAASGAAATGGATLGAQSPEEYRLSRMCRLRLRLDAARIDKVLEGVHRLVMTVPSMVESSSGSAGQILMAAAARCSWHSRIYGHALAPTFTNISKYQVVSTVGRSLLARGSPVALLVRVNGGGRLTVGRERVAETLPSIASWRFGAVARALASAEVKIPVRQELGEVPSTDCAVLEAAALGEPLELVSKTGSRCKGLLAWAESDTGRCVGVCTLSNAERAWDINQAGDDAAIANSTALIAAGEAGESGSGLDNGVSRAWLRRAGSKSIPSANERAVLATVLPPGLVESDRVKLVLLLRQPQSGAVEAGREDSGRGCFTPMIVAWLSSDVAFRAPPLAARGAGTASAGAPAPRAPPVSPGEGDEAVSTDFVPVVTADMTPVEAARARAAAVRAQAAHRSAAKRAAAAQRAEERQQQRESRAAARAATMRHAVAVAGTAAPNMATSGPEHEALLAEVMQAYAEMYESKSVAPDMVSTMVEQIEDSMRQQPVVALQSVLASVRAMIP